MREEGTEKKRKKKKEFWRERHHFSLDFQRSDRRFQAEQEEEFILTARASHRDRSCGISKNPRGRGVLLLGYFGLKCHEKWV